MNYEDMSDFEINKALADTLFPNATRIGKAVRGYPPQCISDDKLKAKYFEIDKHLNPDKYRDSIVSVTHLDLGFEVDYCNNPSDAWPIIVENRIDIEFPDEYGYAVGTASKFIEGDTDIVVDFEKPCEALRAAMIVYLMLKESEK